MLEPLLVRFVPRDDTYYIISGERRYHAATRGRLAGSPVHRENCRRRRNPGNRARSKTCSARTLTPFEEADGLYRLAEQFSYTHEDIARKIAKARSSVTETLSLRNIPESLRRRCLERGINSRSLLLQIARQPDDKKMAESAAAHRSRRPDARRSPQGTPGREVGRPAPAAVHLQLSAGERVLPPARAVPQEPRFA